MISVILGHKCALCGERGRDLDSVGGYGIYHDSRRFFHRRCLRDITCDPEHFKHSQVDMAISITEKLEEEKKQVVERRKKFKASCEKLANYCVDDSRI